MDTGWPLVQQEHQSCIQCGLCLEACPTYRETLDEGHSPRGRIAMIRALEPGGQAARLGDLNGAVVGDSGSLLDLCLFCRSCEAVCPSGVRFGRLMTALRGQLRELRKDRRERTVRSILRSAFMHPVLLRLMLRAIRLAASLRLAGLAVRIFFPRAHRSHFLHLVSSIRIARGQGPVGAVAQGRSGSAGPSHPISLTVRAEHVLLFRGCITPVFFPRVLEAWCSLLQKIGLSYSIPRGQTCCGALHLQHGDLEGARTLARRNIEAFEAAGCGSILVEAAGCGAALKSYGDLLAEDPEYAERARQFAARVQDMTEVLAARLIDQVDAGATMEAAGPAQPVLRVVYHDPCHLRHVQQVVRQPRLLLDGLPSLQRISAPEADLSCGAAGSYSLLQPGMATALGDRKVQQLASTGADLVVTADPGCRLQLGSRLASRGMEVRHILEICDQLWPDGQSGNHPCGRG